MHPCRCRALDRLGIHVKNWDPKTLSVYKNQQRKADVQVNDFSKAERFPWYAEGQKPLSDLPDYNRLDKMRNQLRNWKKSIPDSCLQELVKQDATVSNIQELRKLFELLTQQVKEKKELSEEKRNTILSSISTRKADLVKHEEMISTKINILKEIMTEEGGGGIDID